MDSERTLVDLYEGDVYEDYVLGNDYGNKEIKLSDSSFNPLSESNFFTIRKDSEKLSQDVYNKIISELDKVRKDRDFVNCAMYLNGNEYRLLLILEDSCNEYADKLYKSFLDKFECYVDVTIYDREVTDYVLELVSDLSTNYVVFIDKDGIRGSIE